MGTGHGFTCRGRMRERAGPASLRGSLDRQGLAAPRLPKRFPEGSRAQNAPSRSCWG